MDSLMRVSLGAVTWAGLPVCPAMAGQSSLRAARGGSQQVVGALPIAHASVRTAAVS